MWAGHGGVRHGVAVCCWVLGAPASHITRSIVPGEMAIEAVVYSTVAPLACLTLAC